MTSSRTEKGRRVVSLVFLMLGVALVVAAILLLFLADLPAAVSAGMGVPGLALIAAWGRTIADRQKPA